MKIKEFIKIEELEGETWVRGQLTLKATDEEPRLDEVLGIAIEDIKKGQIEVIKI